MMIVSGALLNDTYYLPEEASGKNTYKCPKCFKNVVLKTSIFKKSKFIHIGETSCDYYNKPREIDVAKNIFIKALRNKKVKEILWQCRKCNGINYRIGEPSVIDYEDGDVITFGMDSEIIITNNGTLKYTFVVTYVHNPKLFKPEPWFEIKVQDIIEERKHLSNIVCSRTRFCKKCTKPSSKVL